MKSRAQSALNLDVQAVVRRSLVLEEHLLLDFDCLQQARHVERQEYR